MTFARIAVAATLCLGLLNGCGSRLVGAAMNRIGGSTATPAVQPDANSAKIWVTLPSRNVKFSMTALANARGVTVWAAKDGSQIALRDGILLSTRGFGRDLMSAQVPAAAQIGSGGEHQRIYFDLDGTDATIRHPFTCHYEQGAADDTGLRHISELCSGEIGTIRNEFWLDGASRVQKSLQWVSQGVGYAAVERNDG